MTAKLSKEVQEKNYYRKEHKYGSFSRTIPLPGDLKTDKAEATFENGVLTLTIPKSEASKFFKVKVQKLLEGSKAQ